MNMGNRHFKGILKNSSWLFGRNVAGAGIALLQYIIIARWLKVENYGLLALTIVYVDIVNQIIDFRIYEAANKYISEFLVNKRMGECFAAVKIFYFIDISTGIIAFLTVFLTAQVASVHLFHQPQLADLITIYGLSLLFSTANGTSTAILGIFNKFDWISIHSMLSALAKLVLVVCFLLAGQGLKGIVFAYVIFEMISGLSLMCLSFILLVKERLWEARKVSSIFVLKQRFKEIGMFLVNTNIYETLTLITKNIDIVLLGFFRNPIEVGYYRLARLFVGTVTIIYEPLYAVVYPAFSKLWANNEIAEIKALIKQVTLFLSVIIVPATILIFIFNPPIIKLAVGKDFLPAAGALRIMIWGILIGALSFWARPILLTIGRPDIPTKGNIISVIMMIAFSLILIPSFGYIGSAIVFVIPRIIGPYICIAFIIKHYWEPVATLTNGVK